MHNMSVSDRLLVFPDTNVFAPGWDENGEFSLGSFYYMDKFKYLLRKTATPQQIPDPGATCGI